MLSCRLSTSRNIQGYRLIPDCPTEELLDVAYLVVQTLKSIESKILVQYSFHEFCSSTIGALIKESNDLSVIIHATYEL